MTLLTIKKVPVEQESSLSMGGTIIFLALFPKNYFLQDVMTSQRKLDMVGTWSTIRKWAKRMPDFIVEIFLPKNIIYYLTAAKPASCVKTTREITTSYDLKQWPSGSRMPACKFFIKFCLYIIHYTLHLQWTLHYLHS